MFFFTPSLHVSPQISGENWPDLRSPPFMDTFYCDGNEKISTKCKVFKPAWRFLWHEHDQINRYSKLRCFKHPAMFFCFFFILVSALIKLFFTLSKVVKSSEYTNIQLTFTLSFFYFSHFRSFFCQPEHLYRWLLPCRWWCVSSVLITGCTWCRRTRACACVCMCVCVFAQIVNHLSITTRWKQPSQQGRASVGGQKQGERESRWMLWREPIACVAIATSTTPGPYKTCTLSFLSFTCFYWGQMQTCVSIVWIEWLLLDILPFIKTFSECSLNLEIFLFYPEILMRCWLL